MTLREYVDYLKGIMEERPELADFPVTIAMHVPGETRPLFRAAGSVDIHRPPAISGVDRIQRIAGGRFELFARIPDTEYFREGADLIPGIVELK